MLRAGDRPTIDKVRGRIGKGSPNTINPMLDLWWKTLSARLDSGPTALHRLPESIATSPKRSGSKHSKKAPAERSSSNATHLASPR
jgi:hypothetical protein